MAFSVEEISAKWHESENLSIFHCNVRSINKNLDQLTVHLSQHSFQYDLIAVTETWLKKGEIPYIPGYTTLSLPRDSTARGVALLFL